jgi:hypothetical protein
MKGECRASEPRYICRRRPGSAETLLFAWISSCRHSVVDELEEAIAANADIPIDIGVKARFAGRHKNPIFGFDVRR